MRASSYAHSAGQTYIVYQQVRTCGAGFFDPACYHNYLRRLRYSLNNYQVRLHAYSLLPREILLLATPASPRGLNRLVSALNRAYSEYFNNRFGRSVRVWGEPRSTPLVDNALLLQCQKYIERLEPEADDEAGDGFSGSYPWNSYCANGFGGRSSLLEPHRAYRDFLGQRPPRWGRYRDFIAAPFSPEAARRLGQFVRSGPGARLDCGAASGSLSPVKMVSAVRGTGRDGRTRSGGAEAGQSL